MQRRRFLRTVGAGSAALLAGCMGDDGTGQPTGTNDGTVGTPGEDRTLRVATYPSFLDAPSTSPGDWVKEEFESEVDATLEWFAPDGQINYFIQRANQGLTIDTDMFVGLVNLNLVRADNGLDGTTLFAETDPGTLENGENIPEEFLFDDSGRVVPFSNSFISFVYDENGVPSTPDTYEKLTTDDFADSLIVPNPQNSETGEMFVLMTIEEYGEDGYLDYWQDLQDNGAQILGDWGDTYNAYSQGEAPIVVSYSTDQVFADMDEDEPMSRHQIAFPDGQGYAYMEGMAKFEDAEDPDLCDEFMEFVIDPDVQAEIAQRNVTMPVVDNASLPEGYQDLVHEPDQTVNFSYDRLQENLEGWIEEWSRQIAGQ